MNFTKEGAASLRSFLNRNSYCLTSFLPSRKSSNPVYLAFDFLNFLNFLIGKPNTHRFSTIHAFFTFLLSLKNKRAALLSRLFIYEESISDKELEKEFSKEDLDLLFDIGLIKIENTLAKPQFRITSFKNFYFISDLNSTKENFVYLGYDSFVLSDFFLRNRSKELYESAVDVGTGTGIQALTMSQHARKATALDINSKALIYAEFNAVLNEKSSILFKKSDLLSAVKNEKFDLLLTNPPFVLMPEKDKDGNVHGYGGGNYGLEITLKLVEQTKDLLADQGEIYIVATSPIVNGKDLLPELIAKKLEGENFEVIGFQIKYSLYKEFYKFHTKIGISKFILYIIRIKKSDHFSYSIKNLPIHKKIFNDIYIFFSKIILSF